MRFQFKILLFLYSFIILINIYTILSIRINKIAFVTHINISKPDFHLNIQSSLMPKPVRQGKVETSKSSKLEHERLKQTLKELKEQSEEKTSTSTKEQRESEINSWRVVLYNDDIHQFTYVTESISKCVPQLPLARAHLITLEAHKHGQAEILRTWKDKAEQYCRELQKFGLTVCTINDKRKS